MTYSFDLNSLVTQFVQDPQSYLNKEGSGVDQKIATLSRAIHEKAFKPQAIPQDFLKNVNSLHLETEEQKNLIDQISMELFLSSFGLDSEGSISAPVRQLLLRIPPEHLDQEVVKAAITLFTNARDPEKIQETLAQIPETGIASLLKTAVPFLENVSMHREDILWAFSRDPDGLRIALTRLIPKNEHVEWLTLAAPHLKEVENPGLFLLTLSGHGRWGTDYPGNDWLSTTFGIVHYMPKKDREEVLSLLLTLGEENGPRFFPIINDYLVDGVTNAGMLKFLRDAVSIEKRVSEGELTFPEKLTAEWMQNEISGSHLSHLRSLSPEKFVNHLKDSAKDFLEESLILQSATPEQKTFYLEELEKNISTFRFGRLWGLHVDAEALKKALLAGDHSPEFITKVETFFQKIPRPKMEKEDGKCPISLEPMDDPVLTRPTYHIFDRTSLTQWMTNNNTDPLSKEEITSLIDLPELMEEIKRVKEENPSFFEG